jgi:hypothetical protein
MTIAEQILGEDLIDLEEVCAILKVSMATARRHLRRGLQHIRTGPRPGGKILTSREALARFVAKLSESGGDAADCIPAAMGPRASAERRQDLDKAAREFEALAPV